MFIQNQNNCGERKSKYKRLLGWIQTFNLQSVNLSQPNLSRRYGNKMRIAFGLVTSTTWLPKIYVVHPEPQFLHLEIIISVTCRFNLKIKYNKIIRLTLIKSSSLTCTWLVIYANDIEACTNSLRDQEFSGNSKSSLDRIGRTFSRLKWLNLKWWNLGTVADGQ